MKLYSQRDPRWADKRIGKSTLTIGRFGCTITSIAMLATYFGDMITPDDLAIKLDFTPDGLLLWESINKKPTPTWGLHFKFERREYGENLPEIKAALRDPDRGVIIQVANRSHWVLPTSSVSPLPDKLKIADPWIGDRTTTGRYKNDITGAAYFRRK